MALEVQIFLGRHVNLIEVWGEGGQILYKIDSDEIIELWSDGTAVSDPNWRARADTLARNELNKRRGSP